MNTLALYDRVNLTAPLSKPEFIAYFNDSAAYIVVKYGEKYACEGKYTELLNVDDGSNIDNLFADAIADNIVFIKTGNVDRKTDFVEKANNAYKTAWSKKITKHQIKMRRY